MSEMGDNAAACPTADHRGVHGHDPEVAMRRYLIVQVGLLAAAFAGLTLIAGSVAADGPTTLGKPAANSFNGIPTVGPIFRGALTGGHSCTGSVLSSVGHDLILTAAHCVSGTAAGWLFAPGYNAGATPYGVWTVVHAYIDPSWTANQDPQHDYAILQVARHQAGTHPVGVEDVTGGNRLGLAPRAGERVTDVAYNAGVDDQPIKCATRVYHTDGYPSFNCHGYADGSSGSPWISSVPGSHISFVRGVIGGLHLGGSYEYTSYSSAFSSDVYRLLISATLHPHPGGSLV
jgi:V8-like Glu-specific endopeptidase